VLGYLTVARGGWRARLIRAGAMSTVLATLAACGSSAATGKPKPSPSPTPSFNPVYGLDYGPWTQGDAPGPAVPDSRIETQLTLLKGRTQWIKIGGSTGGTEDVPKIAHGMGFKVAATAFINGNKAFDDAEVAELEKNVRAGYVDLAMVGNEAVHDGFMKAAPLAALITQVKQDLGGKVPVSTIEPAKEMIANPNLVQSDDLVVANITPFSYQVPESKAMAWITDEYSKVQAASGGKEVRIGETEWPSDGGTFGPGVVADQATQVKFMTEVTAWSRQNHVGAFIFEAFDEPWLSHADSSFGPHWGLWTSAGTLKPGLDALFAKGS